MNRAPRRLIVILSGCAVLTPLVWWGCIYAVQSSAFLRDFSKDRPDAVYQMVFGQRVPEGVTELRASGRHYFTKRWVWIRLTGTNAALGSLIAGAEGAMPPLSQEAARALREDWTSNARYNRADKQRVAWDEAARIPVPRFSATRGCQARTAGSGSV